MGAAPLAAALTAEHREIDDGIEAFAAGLALGEVRAEPLLTTLAALRRHIFLEEELLFPPIQDAGLVMPIQVMLAEHGRIWQVMDQIADRVAQPEGPEGGEDLVRLCRELLALLAQHNLKEEPIVYPRAEVDLTSPQQEELSAFVASGRIPDGWVCRALDTSPGSTGTGRDSW